jgi:hypothetical protein
MISRKAATRSILLLIAAGCVTALPATATAATVRPSVVPPPIPDNGNSCTLSVAGEPQECTAVVGSGLQITSISGTFKHQADYAIDNEKIVYYGPNGTITSTATYNVPAGSQLGPFVWHNPNPTANMTPGDYCTEAEGGYNISDCIDVHS